MYLTHRFGLVFVTTPTTPTTIPPTSPTTPAPATGGRRCWWWWCMGWCGQQQQQCFAPTQRRTIFAVFNVVTNHNCTKGRWGSWFIQRTQRMLGQQSRSGCIALLFISVIHIRLTYPRQHLTTFFQCTHSYKRFRQP